MVEMRPSTTFAPTVTTSGSSPGSTRLPVYLDLARIFRRFRLSLRIRFFRHLALILDDPGAGTRKKEQG